MKIGIIKERKNPPDKRVPFSPQQCLNLKKLGIEVIVEPSEVRCFKDEEYANLGITLSQDLSHCNILMGVKEVPKDALIPGKPYFFFSHTIKKQPYNQELMWSLLDKNIQMVDYECLINEKGSRILGFGKHAGIVGAYNGLLTYGLKHDLYKLKAANLCSDYKELIEQIQKISLPDIKLVITGTGRVGQGAKQLLLDAGFLECSPKDYFSYKSPVFTCLEVSDFYNAGVTEFDYSHFYENSSEYKSSFRPYLKESDLFISAHYWDNQSPPLFNWEDLQSTQNKVSVIADITCDIKGSVPTTLRASTIANPIYGVDVKQQKECDYNQPNAIAVMAVDNLPCELPKDASEDFGNALLKHIIPEFDNFKDSNIINMASICKEGKLTARFSYLSEYASK